MFDNDSYGRALKIYLKQGLAMLQATRDGALIGEVLTLISTSHLDPDGRVGILASIHGVKSEDGVWYAPVLTVEAFASDGDTITGDVDRAVLALPLVSGKRTQLYEESLPGGGPSWTLLTSG